VDYIDKKQEMPPEKGGYHCRRRRTVHSSLLKLAVALELDTLCSSC
jgi:hypothetical protein